MLPPASDDHFSCIDTKLHDAVRYSDLEEVIEALRDGLDPNQIGTYLWSPLHEACSNGEDDIVKVLIQHGGDPNKADSLRGCTALHYAASLGHKSCLQVLLQAGGKYDIQNKDGKSCLDVAVDPCLALLAKNASKHLTMVDEPEIVKSETKQVDLPQTVLEDKIKEEENSIDLDEISIATSESSNSSIHRSWSPNVVGLSPNLVLGSVQMSFEYNSKKDVFKVRVWQVEDLLLPPAETSKIIGIYVKSYLHPDKSKHSKRKTEEIPVSTSHETNAADTLHTDSGTSVVFKPSCFKFCRPLEYTKVTKSMVESKIVEVVICVVQKFTRRSYAVSSWNMPLDKAVRKLLKEKFPFKPCLSLNIPQNMRVYHAGQLRVPFGLSYSNPNLRRPESTGSWAVPYNERSVSDSDLLGVKTEKCASSKASSIELTVEEEKEEEEFDEVLQQIAVMELREQSEVHVNMQETSEETSLSCVVSEDNAALAEVEIHLPAEKPAKTKSKIFKRKSKRKKFSQDQNVLDLEMLPRPETPSWDDYNEPLTLVSVECEDDFPHTPPLVSLPMATTLDMPEVHHSFKPQEEKNLFSTSLTIPIKVTEAAKTDKDIEIEMPTISSRRKDCVQERPSDKMIEFAV